MFQRRTVAFAISALMTAVGVAIIAVALTGAAGTARSPILPEPESFAAPSVAAPAAARPDATETPPPAPTPVPSSAPVDRLVIPKIGVDAAIVVLGVDKNGVMQDPKGPREVAWYNFSAHPGWTGNAVFAGHVDYHDYGPAVFWKLRELHAGDEVDVRLADGSVFKYAVVSLSVYTAGEEPVQEIVGPTDSEVMTMITCTGTFDSRSRQYDKRVVVRAERVPSSQPSAAGR